MKVCSFINDFCIFFILNRDDMEMMLNKIVPEGLPYRHSCEGPDDMVIFLPFFFFLHKKAKTIFFF